MERVFTRSEVSRHATPEDAWIIVSGRVYDITLCLKKHPPGLDAVLPHLGKDCTEVFNSTHSEGTQERLLKQCDLGRAVAAVHVHALLSSAASEGDAGAAAGGQGQGHPIQRSKTLPDLANSSPPSPPSSPVDGSPVHKSFDGAIPVLAVEQPHGPAALSAPAACRLPQGPPLPVIEGLRAGAGAVATDAAQQKMSPSRLRVSSLGKDCPKPADWQQQRSPEGSPTGSPDSSPKVPGLDVAAAGAACSPSMKTRPGSPRGLTVHMNEIALDGRKKPQLNRMRSSPNVLCVRLGGSPEAVRASPPERAPPLQPLSCSDGDVQGLAVFPPPPQADAKPQNVSPSSDLGSAAQ
eukprot:m51a1_g514 cytochrome b5 domain containing protein (350) ;mRNA; f:321525-322725